ncbi:MAG TPA: ABC transporter substrate-binding protein [Caldimonas sp.]|jgi:NitT/TauT family transport system substrate-binding protein
MTSRSLSRRRLLGALAGAAALVAPAFVRQAGAQGLTKVSYQTGWLAQPEHGGFYQALATGLYRDAGLDVDIRRGGPQLNTTTLFLAGSVDFCEFDSFRQISFVNESLPGVAVAAFFQKDPRILLSHPGVGNDSLPQLKGKPILVATAGRQTYWQWLKTRFGFVDDQIRPYTFNIAPFLADKQISMQGYIASEPFAARQAGVEPVIHLLADSGFDNYSSVLLASPKMVKEQPALVQRFIDATAKGWESYLHGDPAPANAIIQKQNPEMSDDKIAYAIEAIRKYGIVETAETKAMGIGAMSDARWKRFYDDMVAAGAQPAGLDVKRGYTLQFVNRKRA